MLNVVNKASVTVVIDENIFKADKLAFRAWSGSDSLFVSSSALKAFLGEHAGEYQTLDFANLSAPAVEKKEVEKTEGGINYHLI